MGAHGEECRVETAVSHLGRKIIHLGIEPDLDSGRLNARHLGVQNFARQAILGNAEAQHAARLGTGFPDRDVVTQAPQMIRGGQTRRARADH